VAVKQTDYDWAYLAAAVCPTTGEALGVIDREMNTGVMNDLLANLSRLLGADRHAVLVWDNAGFHTSGRLEVPANITILPLPPYSPELNCVERVWAWMRSHSLSNRAYADHDAIVAAIERACDLLPPERLMSICRTAWLERGD
jgi:hypothetical protein